MPVHGEGLAAVPSTNCEATKACQTELWEVDVSGRAGKGWQHRPTRGWHRTRMIWTQTRKNAGNGRLGEQLSVGAGETLGSSLALQKKKCEQQCSLIHSIID